MKTFKSILLAASAVLLAACVQHLDEPQEAQSVLSKEQVMTFAATNAPEQEMEIYADGSWKAEVESEWVHVTPMYGDGPMTVVITVDDNYDSNGAVDNPRSTLVCFRGASTLSGRYGTLTINQKGDTYKGKPEYTVAGLIAAEPDVLCKLPSVTVMALAKTGFIASDATGNVFVSGSSDGLNVGDQLFINGKRGEVKGLPAFLLDETDVRGSGSVEYPPAKDITSEIAGYAAETSEFVSVQGSIVGLVTNGVLSGAAIRIPGQPRRMMMTDAPATAGFAQFNYHKATISGYYNGTSGSNASFVVAKIADQGEDPSVKPVPAEPGTVLFFDNFDWMDPYVAYYNSKNPSTPLGKSVEENNASGNAPNVYTQADLVDCKIMEAFADMGYVDINAAVTSMYPQDTYWKFGKTSYHTGIRIPFVNYFGEVELSFDWSPHMTGSGNIDKVNPVVEVITGETSVVSDPFVNDWQKGQMGWKNVMTKINITPESEIIVRPQYMVDHDGVDQMRWYIDNIKVRVPSPDVPPVYAVITTDTELLTFEGSGGEQTIKVKSDHDFSISPSEDWITCDFYGGDKDEETAIKVTCAQSDLSVLRKAELTIISADSSISIPIVQSAAGQELEDLISLNKNSVKVVAKGGVVKVRMQSNVDYKVDIDVPWIMPAYGTKGRIDVADISFLVQENEDTVNGREGHVIFSYKDMRNVLTVTQDPKATRTVLFEDDFSWLSDQISEYNAANPTNPVGDFVGGNYPTISDRSGANAPNAYTAEPFKTKFPAALSDAGYTDLNPSAKVIYPQDTYLKFGKTSVHTGLSFQPLKALKNKADVCLSFDWVRHIQGSGKVDPVTLKVFIEGNGVFEQTGTAESPDLTTAQVDNQDPFWTNASLNVLGADADTKFTIISKEGKESLKTSGAHRYHLDNIKVVKLREVVFKDDFSWLDPVVKAYRDAGGVVGKTVEGEGSDAPNIWNIADLKAAIEPLMTSKGYTDLNPGEKLMYLQDGYLKFSKTGGHNTALQLQVNTLPATPTEVEITFDYCMMVQGDGMIDEGPMGVYIIGDGQFDNGTKLSDPQVSAQVTSQFLWNKSAVLKASGVTKDTKFVFLMQRVLRADGSFNWGVSGAGRFFIDNIEIVSR